MRKYSPAIGENSENIQSLILKMAAINFTAVDNSYFYPRYLGVDYLRHKNRSLPFFSITGIFMIADNFNN